MPTTVLISSYYNSDPETMLKVVNAGYTLKNPVYIERADVYRYEIEGPGIGPDVARVELLIERDTQKVRARILKSGGICRLTSDDGAEVIVPWQYLRQLFAHYHGDR